MNLHYLKSHPPYYAAVELGDKTFELRYNDRGFCVGDLLELREWNPSTQEYTGRSLQRRVTYMLTGPAFGLREGWSILSLGAVR